MVDSFAERGRGWGLSFESTLPAIRIDYIWHTPNLKCLNCGPRSSQASDHFPMVAEFQL
jgi:endonuclease/exonuclease/phosphatase (EEP) superfamily protein YafD